MNTNTNNSIIIIIFVGILFCNNKFIRIILQILFCQFLGNGKEIQG